MKKQLVTGLPKLWAQHPGERLECPGCQYPVIARVVYDTIDELGVGGRTILINSSACGHGIMLTTSMDAMFPNHGQGIDVATGVKRLRPECFVVSYGGDGDIAAIGAGAFVNAAQRAEKYTVIMVNNGHFAMTGGQLAPTTLMEQVTTTSPKGRRSEMGYPARMPEMIATVEGTVYSARGAVNSPANYQKAKRYIKRAFQKQIDNVGFSFVELLSACPTGWHMSPRASIKWIEEKMIPKLPLGEFKNIDRIE
ncbi:MAG: thiamine pyrophosphate-dependent enzyme [Desulfatiglans sp.]|jgi:2-oxoglutarate ferredoxin oxidoreductase subunit beta|nr:thiamine pyrophosphate-dependent enzyme [Desulfatiglans sp.]